MVLNLLFPAFLAFVVAWLIELGDRRYWRMPEISPQYAGRRLGMTLCLAAVLFFLLLGPVFWASDLPMPDLEALHPAELFSVHGMLAVTLLFWFFLGHGGDRRAFGGAGEPVETRLPEAEADIASDPAPDNDPDADLASDPALASVAGADGEVLAVEGPAVEEPAEEALPRPLAALVKSCGLAAPRGLRELALGLVIAPFLWAAVVGIMALAAMALKALGAEALVPQETPPVVAYLVTLPVALRLALSVSAGVVEEIFFRGFLQTRVGIPLATALFVLAHVSYDAPLMLLGVGLLSLAFGWLTQRRGNVWASVTAHAVFDAIQLLWVLPAVQGTQVLPQAEALDGLSAILCDLLGRSFW